MKKYCTRLMALALVACMIIVIAACTLPGAQQNGTQAPADNTKQSSLTESQKVTEPEEVVYVEWWRTNQGGITWEKDGPVSKWLSERTGVGFWMPLVIWEGGTGYYNRLQTRAATGDLPDIFMPRNGIENTLIEDGLIWELSKYLPEYAPNVWNAIPKEIWNVVRETDPTGNGGIYYIPNVNLYNNYGTFIRKDWLDEAGLSIPATQQEYVDALRAFRKRGDNILPTIGREFGRWMDHLFYMYDVAMYEGYPMFDIYNGELTYSAVTPNMKEALGFIRSLYEEKLLDNETFLNKANSLWEKVKSDRVGSWYHIPNGLNGMALNSLLKTNDKAEVVVLPRIAAPGYEGYITIRQIWGPYWSFGKKDEKMLIASLKMMNWLADPNNREEIMYGVEGFHYNVVDGKKKMILDYDINTVEKKLSPEIAGLDESILINKVVIEESTEPLLINAAEQTNKAIVDSQKDLHRMMAQDGMPAAVFEGFPDINSHKLYQEYMTQIIIGEKPIDAFDEFVQRWYESGGEEVTKRARDWYEKVSK